MRRHEIPQDQWERIADLLPGRAGCHGGVAKDNRLFINAIWYMAKTGIPWRDLPERFGDWDTVYHRYNEWCKRGVWQRIFEIVQDPDLEWMMLDSTVIRAHHHAAGMNGEDDDQGLGRSRGGFGTKIHLAVDSLGNPVSIHLSPGQDADSTHAEKLLSDHEPEAVLADKAYDTNQLVEMIENRGAEVVIPPKKNRVEPREIDKVVYKERNKVERCVNKLKQFRRVATRYEKTARNFLGMVLFAAITIWMK
jgi:transposase